MTIQRISYPLEDVQWLGQSVHSVSGPLGDLAAAMPVFTREDLTYGNALNEYLDLIIREPEGDDERRVPVSTVSKRYALIQHTEAIDWLCAGFREQKWDLNQVLGTVWLSDYGERMRVRVPLPVPETKFALNDVIRADVVLWNSVDRSRSFELAIRWERLVCLNGLAIPTVDRLRKIHNANWMSRASPVEFLRERLPLSAQEIVISLNELIQLPLAEATIVPWINDDVTRQWGKIRGARLLHILRTGHDCAVGRSTAEMAASTLRVVAGEKVPGAPVPAATIYDAYQALLWLAGKETSIDRQESMADEADSLVRRLIPKHK